jgi:hypothetical protein
MLEQEQKPKVKGTKSRRPIRPPKKEFVLKVEGLETHTFNIGNAKYAAKYKKFLNAIVNYAQREYEGGPEIQSNERSGAAHHHCAYLSGCYNRRTS